MALWPPLVRHRDVSSHLFVQMCVRASLGDVTCLSLQMIRFNQATVTTVTKITLLCFRSVQVVLSVSKTKATGSLGLDVVQQYKYLGTVCDNKLTFDSQVDSEQIYFLGKLKKFKLLILFVWGFFVIMLNSLFLIELLLTFLLVSRLDLLSFKYMNQLHQILIQKITSAPSNDPEKTV